MKQPRGLTILASAALLLAMASTSALARHEDKAKPPALYPNATRAEPKLDLTSQRESDKLNAGLNAVNSGDSAKAEQLLQPIVDSSRSKYAQALALQGLANVKYKNNDIKGAIALLQRSLAIGVIPNETYFQLEYELAQFQAADQQYQAALGTITKWRAEGKRETGASYGLEGTIDYRMGKYPEAIAAIKKAQSLTDKPEDSWNQILMASYSESGQDEKAAELAQQQVAANPTDPNALNNAAAVLMQAHKYPEAIQLLEKAHANGGLKSEANYVNLAKLYLISAQGSSNAAPDANKAEDLLNEGMSKGVVTASADNYILLGQSAEIGNHIGKALDAYEKAVPLAKNGEPSLRAGWLQLSESKYSKAKGFIQEAIAKGVPHVGTAYMMLAECERGLKNKPAAIAAMKMAAKQPETAAKAKAWLKKAGVGK